MNEADYLRAEVARLQLIIDELSASLSNHPEICNYNPQHCGWAMAVRDARAILKKEDDHHDPRD